MEPTSSQNTPDSQLHDQVIQQTEDKIKTTLKPTLSVKIIHDSGDICVLSNITTDVKISELMKKSFQILFKTDKKSVFKYNVISIRTGKVLTHFQTVAENEVTNDDELLLVERYVMQDDEAMKEVNDMIEDMSKPGRSKQKVGFNQVPTIAIINDMTKDLPVKNKKKKSVVHSFKSPYCNKYLVQIELNNVFLSLIEISASMLHFNDASVVYKDIVRKLRLDFKPDKVRLRQLVETGYGVEICKISLILKRNNLAKAADWLMNESTSITREDLDEIVSLSLDFKNIDVNADNFADTIRSVAKYLMKKQELDAYIDPFNISIVMSMELGFSVDEVRRAFRKCLNETNSACLFLMGELQELELHSGTKAFESESTTAILVDKLLRDPEVLLALTDRNMLLGLLDMLESSDDTFTPWSEGCGIDILLRRIVEAFETEKHNIHGCRDIFPSVETSIIMLDDYFQ